MKNKSALLALKARAKINLYLYVGPRRADGYHSIDTIFQEISLHDEMSFRVVPGDITLRIKGAKLSAGPDNLIVRALEALRRSLKISKGMDVTLTKNIPMGAGLGGGSSDAAAALKAGWKLWTGKAFSSKRVPVLLNRCAKKLGADVSFFLVGGTARAKGIGEKLYVLPKTKKRWLVLVYPRVHVSTPKAYGWIDETRQVRTRVDRSRNHFEAVVLPRFPAIRLVKKELTRLGCSDVTMSGSGSSVFGFISSKEKAEKIKRALRVKAWDVFAAHTI
jgi:4-diphosphocytidyl-2-C-methyl-D-erythritol kinase